MTKLLVINICTEAPSGSVVTPWGALLQKVPAFPSGGCPPAPGINRLIG